MNTHTTDPQFEQLLSYLKRNRGFDFTAYKRPTLQRRVQKRMDAVEAADYVQYQDYLEVHQDEFRHLFNMILINVTSFFRDPEAWEFLDHEILPRVLDGTDPIRIWVAGCASGPEAYTVAIKLAEKLGPKAYRDRVKIYATDLDDEALNQARSAMYTEKDLENVPPDLVAKYFERVHGKFCMERELRRNVIFGKHDLIQDAPISRVDLLLCRNTLMYFNAEAQSRILNRFHFALNDEGYLFLGSAETLLTHGEIFSAVDLKNRIFSKVNRARVRDRNLLLRDPTLETGAGSDFGALREAALDAIGFATIILDQSNHLAVVNHRARDIFGIHARDAGRLFQDLDISFRPIDLRSGIEAAQASHRTIIHKDVAFSSAAGERMVFEIRIAPMLGVHNQILGTMITAEDVTHYKRLQDELLSFNQELETAYEEVQSTNEELQTTNEELQSTVEELETTNEELHSTNEELETMNEELQSTNEELETINSELQRRSIELKEANSFQESILASLQDGVMVVDRDLHVIAWNNASEEFWGMRQDEVKGKHMLNLDIGLSMDGLLVQVRACLANQQTEPVSLEATNRRGRTVSCSVGSTPLIGFDGATRGVILTCQCSPTTADAK